MGNCQMGNCQMGIAKWEYCQMGHIPFEVHLIKLTNLIL